MLRDEKLLAAVIAVGIAVGAWRSLDATGAEPAAARTADRLLHRVDVDRADAAELTALPGIGEVLAERIVADRSARGPFGRIEALERVHGVGPATVARLRDRTRFAAEGRAVR